MIGLMLWGQPLSAMCKESYSGFKVQAISWCLRKLGGLRVENRPVAVEKLPFSQNFAEIGRQKMSRWSK
jgi:hypothetical protein